MTSTKKSTKVKSICVKCLCSDWCKAYDKTDLSLNDCTGFIDKNDSNKLILKNFI